MGTAPPAASWLVKKQAAILFYAPARILLAMFTRSGRAVVFPIFKGYFERWPADASEPALLRDHIITTYEDLGRTIDYLANEAHPSMDSKLMEVMLDWLDRYLGPV